MKILFEHEIVELEDLAQLRCETIGVEEILETDRAARDLVLVRRADAAAGRADFRFAHGALARLIERHVIGKHQGTGRRDLEAGADLHARAFELADLLHERRRRDDDAVADVDRDAGMENAGRNQAQHRLAAGDDERVAGIVAALEPHDALRVLGQPVDDLAFPLVAPLGPDDDDVFAHGVDVR